VTAPGKEQKRDRTLSDNEIKEIWEGCDELGSPFGPFVRALLLTAQRREEVATMKWADLDLEDDEPTWTLPREATKADRAHGVPLAPAVVEILQSVPEVGSYVFSTGRRGDKAISGFSAAKRRIDKLTGLDGWTFHDLRRTAASGMARLNVPPHVLSRVLNHSPGNAEGVTAIYNRHGYEPEKRQALDAWARHVQSLIKPTDDKVVPFSGPV
jgi:integrase